MTELLPLFLIAFLSATLLPGGSEAYLGYLVYQNEYSLLLLVIVATIGNTLGGFTNYLLGFWIDSRFIKHSKKQLDSKKQKTYHYAKQLINRWGYWALLFAWTPLIGDILCMIAGVYRLNWQKSLLLIGIGKLLRYIFIVFISESILFL